jgi:beta-glucosidase
MGLIPGSENARPSRIPLRVGATAVAVFIAVWLISRAGGRAETEPRPWADASRLPAERANAALEWMTWGEKLSLVHGGIGAPWGSEAKPTGAVGSAGFFPGVPRLGIPPLQETDAELGVANPGEIRRGDTATAMPSNLALASTWDADLARRQGEAVGREARAKGFSVLLGGTANLIRDPRGGRDFEYFSEDPLLTGILSGGEIAGAQSQHIISTVKHFALNDQETDRVVLDARIDPAAARESDLLAFEIAIERGGPLSVMCAYNQVNSVYACENAWLLNDVLKTDWRYPGFVMSDWGAVHSTVASTLAGLDQESGEQLDIANFYERPLAEAVASGQAPLARLNDMAKRVLSSIFASGLYEYPPAPGLINLAESDQTALDIAREGAVLLKNAGALPLDAGVAHVAVIGGLADRGVLSGGGSSQVVPRGGPAAVVPIADKSGAWVFDPSSPLEALRKRFPRARIVYDDGRDPARAAQLAARSDVAIVFALQWKTETRDADNLELPDNQDRLIEEVAAANSRTTVVLETGGPVLMPWLGQVAAVLEAWYPGQKGGDAIADILSGAVNPSGRLPVTFPRSEAQLPHPRVLGDPKGAPLGPVGRGGTYGRVFVADYSEGAAVGYKWFAQRGEQPLFPFGFGLSYTTVALSHLEVAGATSSVKAEVTIRNTGIRPDAPVVQLYVSRDEDPDFPIRLAGWARVELQPGEERKLSIAVDPRLLARFDERARRWRVAAGNYKVSAGFDVEHLDLIVKSRWEAADLPP